MDSSAYRYFIIELQKQPDSSFALLPLHFVKSRVEMNPDSYSSLQLFLQSVINTDSAGNAALLPEMLAESRNFFGNLFMQSHKALLDVLAGIAPQSHPFRHNGAHLARFLSFCGYSDCNFITAPTDACSKAMVCFLLEGLLFAGWCPDIFKVTAKRAAHLYFISLKKTFHHIQTSHKATILGYMWGAWLLTQKTASISDSSPDGFSAAETFEWNIFNENKSYLARTFGKPPILCLIPQSPYEIPHPVFHIWRPGKTGLSLYLNNEPVMPAALLDTSEIVRPRITGNKFVYKCRTTTIPELQWTVVFLFHERTTYRIDVLKLPPCVEPVAIRAEIRLENEMRLEEIKKGCFTGKSPENSVIHFIQDPLGFRLERQGENGISAFTSDIQVFSGHEFIQLVCAWARGKGITALNEIKLLGIFD